MAVLFSLYTLETGTLLLYLRTDYQGRIIIHGVFFFLFSVILIAAAVYYLRIRYAGPLWPKILIVLTALLFLHRTVDQAWSVIPFEYKSFSSRPAAHEYARFSAGPFVQFAPDGDGGASYSFRSLEIWWFDPEGQTPDYLLAVTGTLLEGADPGSEPRMVPYSADLTPDSRRKSVSFRNLQPGETLTYFIPGLTENSVSVRVPGASATVNFIAAGDMNDKGPYTLSYTEQVNLFTLRIIDADPQPPWFRAELGDISHYGTDLYSWEAWFRASRISSPSMPLAQVLGNHEFMKDYGKSRDYWFSNPHHYFIENDTLLYIALNPYDGPGIRPEGHIVSSHPRQVRAVRERLAAASGKKWIAAAIHVPLLSTGDYGSNKILLEQYFELFREFRVDLVLSGHDHHFECFHVDEEKDWGGTLYVVAGTGGSRPDEYIMTRKNRRWLNWYQDRDDTGLFADDIFTRRYHVYGELSWGFVRVDADTSSLTVSYYRMMSLPDYFDMTGITPGDPWEMEDLDEYGVDAAGQGLTTPVFVIEKKREFPE